MIINNAAKTDTFAETANVDYRLSLLTKENKFPFSIFRIIIYIETAAYIYIDVL